MIEPGAKILHGDVVDTMLQKKTSVEGHEYDVCEKGCKLFGVNDEDASCEHCASDRFRNEDSTIAKSTMKILSIGDMVAQLLADDDKRKELRYRKERESIPGVIKDFFDGEAYKTFKDQGNFENSDDVAIALFTDGFVNQKRGKTSYTMVHVIILNYDPSLR
jgi:hypothetical protein